MVKTATADAGVIMATKRGEVHYISYTVKKSTGQEAREECVEFLNIAVRAAKIDFGLTARHLLISCEAGVYILSTN